MKTGLTIETFDKLRRVQDAIFCLFEIGLRPDIQEELRKHEEIFKQEIENQDVEIKQTKYIKKTIPKDIRWAVWERDNFTCQECGARKNLSVDHIHPESRGGEATMENCQTLCKSCNSKKGIK